jgi:hypothetical protein
MSIGEFPKAISAKIQGISLAGTLFKIIEIKRGSGFGPYFMQGYCYLYKLFDTSGFTLYFGYVQLAQNNFNFNEQFSINVPEIVQKMNTPVDLPAYILYKNQNTSNFVFRNGRIEFNIASFDTTAQGMTML